MFFLVRIGFWFALVLLLLPLGHSSFRDESEVGPFEAVIAARRAIQDVAGMCDRQPEVCVTGKAALRTIGSRASDTARTFSDTLDRTLDEDTHSSIVPVPTPRPAESVGPAN